MSADVAGATLTKMRRLAAAVLIVGCASDPAVGTADWTGGPGPSALFEKSYSEPIPGGWTVKTASYDEEIHCSEVKTVGGGGLTVDLTDRALEAVGEVLITADPQNPSVASARLRLGTTTYTDGSVSITDLDGTIRATFTATASGGPLLTGYFDATRCP